MRADTQVRATFGHRAPASVPQPLTVGLVAGGPQQFVTSVPPGIKCPGVCKAFFPAGTRVVLSERFPAQWQDDCVADQAAKCTLVLDAPADVGAYSPRFEPPKQVKGENGFGVSVTVSGSGTVTAPGIKCGGATGTLFDCQNIFGPKATVVLTAKPGKNTRFAGWNQFCTGKKPRCTLFVSAPMTVGAVFRR
jgi:hypothetical protein